MLRKIILIIIFLEIKARKFNIKEGTEPEEKVEYRPDKYVKNSLLDVMLGNKTFIDLMFRDFRNILRKITTKRSINNNDMANVTVEYPKHNKVVKRIAKGYIYDKDKVLQIFREIQNFSYYQDQKYDYHYHPDDDDDPYFANM